MSEITIEQKIKSVSIEAVVIRADGTIEDLGVISHSDWPTEDEPDKEE